LNTWFLFNSLSAAITALEEILQNNVDMTLVDDLVTDLGLYSEIIQLVQSGSANGERKIHENRQLF